MSQPVDPLAHHALLVIDPQRGFDDHAHWGGNRNNPSYEENVAALVARWRRLGRPVVFVRHDSTEEGSPLRPGRPGNAFRPEIQGEPDLLVSKRTNSAFYGQPDYMLKGCAVSPEATHWLFERGVRVMGIDAWSWDAPLDRQAREAQTRCEPGIFWAAHQADLPYAQIERLVNLGQLPATGFQVACFPLRIQRGSAGPCRAVAILAEVGGARSDGVME